MEKIKKILQLYRKTKAVSWQAKYYKSLSKYGVKFKDNFKSAIQNATLSYYGVTPGDAIDVQIFKMLCKDSSQAALDSHKVTTIAANSCSTSSDIVYAFDYNSLTQTDLYYLQKDLNIFNSLGDLIDCRLCRKFVILIPLGESKRVVCKHQQWIDVVLGPLIGGFGNLFVATCIQDVAKECGMLAATINFSNILTLYERKFDTCLTIILINACLLNKQDEKIRPLTRNGTSSRREFLTRSCFETCKRSLLKANKNEEIDNLNENYARIILQQPPLVGTNFNYFSVIENNNNNNN